MASRRAQSAGNGLAEAATTRVDKVGEDGSQEERIQSGKAAKASRMSAFSSSGASATTTTTTAAATKGGTPYKLRRHRPSNSSSSAENKTGETTETTETTEAGEEPGETTELSKKEQQQRDLFGDDYKPAGRHRRASNPPLDESELESRSVQQLQSYAVERSQDVTQTIEDCVRIAEDSTGIASTTLSSLHEQGEQIRRTHLTAVKAETELTVGEKLLGSLGGMFSRRWKPKKGAKITGPQVAPDSYRRKTAQADRTAVLSYDNKHDDSDAKTQAQARINKYEGLSSTQVQLEMEREHQDEALSGLGDIVSNLKNMSREMNEEVEKQTASMGDMEHDVDAISVRVKQSYQRTRYLVSR